MLPGDIDANGDFRQQLMAALQDPEVVNLLHQYSDYDTTPDGLHRSQGLRHDQSAYGDHTHTGTDSSVVPSIYHHYQRDPYFISSAPASANTNNRDLILELPADFSNSFTAEYIKILGANTLGNPPAGSYKYSLETAAHFLIYDTTTSGKNNGSLSNADGRTAAVAYRTMLYHGGQGDAFVYNAYIELYSSGLPGATHWLANAAAGILNGDIGVTNGDHQYMNTTELNHSDGGFDSAAIAAVYNFNRTNDTAAFGEVWMGVRLQSNGTKSIDVGFSITGLAKRGLDTSQAALAVDKGAITLAQDQRIYFASSSTPMNGINWYSNVPGTVYMDYNSVLAALELALPLLALTGPTTATTATGGTHAIPANAVEFLPIVVNGNTRKIPLLAV